MIKLKHHYAIRLIRSVAMISEVAWQTPCGVDGVRVQMTTILRDVTCLKCQDWLSKHARILGKGRAVTRLRRQGRWGS